MLQDKLILSGNSLTVEEVVRAGRGELTIELDSKSLEICKRSRAILDRAVEQEHIIYGVNTSFGPMCNKIINNSEIEQLQFNLIRSHAAGMGDNLSEEIARATLVIRLNTLVKGFSGVRVELLNHMRDMANSGIAPVIPEQGSVGASGDLIHLAHLGLGIIGEGKLIYKGEIVNAEKALKAVGISPFVLSYKEGIAIMNGTAAMSAIAAFAIEDSKKLLNGSILSASFGMEIFGGIDDAFDPDLHKIKPHPGQVAIASKAENLFAGSRNITFRKDIHGAVKKDAREGVVFETDATVQDVYSIRCTPQVLAPVYEALEYAEKTVTTEINSSNDNPLVIPDEGKVIHGGNFHGQSISFAMDMLRIGLSTLCNISERRLNKLLDKNLSEGLPENLIVDNIGLQMGFMGAQYLATSTTAENRQLAAPMSVNSISSNESNQDIVSMGTVSARLTYKAAQNAKKVLTLEILADLQALGFRHSDRLGVNTSKMYNILAKDFKQYDNSTIFQDMLIKYEDILFNGKLLNDLENL